MNTQAEYSTSCRDRVRSQKKSGTMIANIQRPPTTGHGSILAAALEDATDSSRSQLRWNQQLPETELSFNRSIRGSMTGTRDGIAPLGERFPTPRLGPSFADTGPTFHSPDQLALGDRGRGDMIPNNVSLDALAAARGVNSQRLMRDGLGTLGNLGSFAANLAMGTGPQSLRLEDAIVMASCPEKDEQKSPKHTTGRILDIIQQVVDFLLRDEMTCSQKAPWRIRGLELSVQFDGGRLLNTES